MKEGKIRKFDDTQRTDGSKTETTLSSVDTRGSWPINKPTTAQARFNPNSNKNLINMKTTFKNIFQI